IAASRMCQGVTKSGSPTPSEITSCPFIFATSSKKSRMPLLGSAATWRATQPFGSVFMAATASGRDVKAGRVRVALVQEESLILVAAQHEMRGGREHALDRREFLGHE